MKVFYINVTFDSGSTGRIIKSCTDVLEKNNIEWFAAYAIGNNIPKKNIYKYINTFEFFVIRAMRKLFGKHSLGTTIPTLKLIRKIKKENPDIIHLHVIHHQSCNYKLLFNFLKNYGKKVCYTMHDCWAFTGGCYYYSAIDCEKFTKGCLNCEAKKNRIDIAGFRISKAYEVKKNLLTENENLYVTTVSQWLFDEVKKSFLKNKPIYKISNGIDVHSFKPLNVKKDDKFVILGVATAWVERKGLKEFLELSKLIDYDMKIVLVGQIADASVYREFKNVEFVGSITSKEELSKYYSMADVFVHLSTEETFGLVTAEAMACGTPVVVYNKTACPECVTNGCGQIVNYDDGIDGVFKAIEVIRNNKTDYSNVCRSNVVENFSTEKMVEGYMSLYKNIF